ncbi:MAG: BamA/TamA family outer membrane protein [Scytolyngbya sp. HA4215-MV1]|jgi:outer membrane protein insertion porin family|nr:BamA/TamA family outer membrane protein [Scytolyngbya sp. HA4215-MV1]
MGSAAREQALQFHETQPVAIDPQTGAGLGLGAAQSLADALENKTPANPGETLERPPQLTQVPISTRASDLLAQEFPTPSTTEPTSPPPESPSEPTSTTPAVQPRKGFSIHPGSGIVAPSALQGVTRPRTVLNGSHYDSGFSVTGNARLWVGENQSFLLDAIGGDNILGLDLSYIYATQSPREGFAINAFTQRSESPAFQNGDRDVDLPNGDTPLLHRLGGGIEYFRPLGKKLDAALGINYQRVSVRDSLFTSDVFRVDELGNRLTESRDGQDDLLTVNLAAVYDTSDDYIEPTQGSRIRLGADQAIPVGNASISFTRLSGSVSQFIPLNLFGFTAGPRTLALNFQAGTIIGDVPPYEAYNLGGSESVRGYSKGEVGSGSSFIQATAEYRFPIFSFAVKERKIDVGGVLFVDYATDLGTADEVTGNPAEARDKPGDGLGFGAGLRARTPIGLLRLEFALNDNGDSEVHFVLGGDRF